MRIILLIAILALTVLVPLKFVIVSLSTSQADDSKRVYLGGYINRFIDEEKHIICYSTGPSGLSCLKDDTY